MSVYLLIRTTAFVLMEVRIDAFFSKPVAMGSVHFPLDKSPATYSPGHFPLPDNSPSLLRGVGHSPLPPPPSANLPLTCEGTNGKVD